jgi:hypothetical protein
MQNKANFMRFSSENADFTKKQTQLKPIQTQFNPIQSQFNPKQTQFKPNFTPQMDRTEGRCRMSETTCLCQLQFKTVFYIIIVLLDSKMLKS